MGLADRDGCADLVVYLDAAAVNAIETVATMLATVPSEIDWLERRGVIGDKRIQEFRRRYAELALALAAIE